MQDFVAGFRKFLLRGNVIDLAVAVVLGVAFTAVVTSLVKGIILPIIGIFGGVPDFSGYYFTINNSRFLIGDFINALLSFIVIAFVIYVFVVIPVNRLMDRVNPPAAPKTRDCPECLSKIPVAAKRCAFCASPVAPEGGVS